MQEKPLGHRHGRSPGGNGGQRQLGDPGQGDRRTIRDLGSRMGIRKSCSLPSSPSKPRSGCWGSHPCLLAAPPGMSPSPWDHGRRCGRGARASFLPRFLPVWPSLSLSVPLSEVWIPASLARSDQTGAAKPSSRGDSRGPAAGREAEGVSQAISELFWAPRSHGTGPPSAPSSGDPRVPAAGDDRYAVPARLSRKPFLSYEGGKGTCQVPSATSCVLP